MRRRGFSVFELIVVMALFSVISLVGYAAMRQSAELYRRSWARSSAQRELRRAEVALQRDLQSTAVTGIRRSTSSSSLGVPDGDAVWMLSPYSLVDGKPVRDKKEATPFWQNQILYYLTVPQGHTGCTGGAAANGKDDQCPHKVLIRKIIDSGPAPDVDNAGSIETTLTSVGPYLTRPAGTSVSAMVGEPGVKDVRIVATNLLGFDVDLVGGEVRLSLRATGLEEAQKTLAVGSVHLTAVPSTLTHQLSVFPPNP